jgi:hypothetical protein
MLFGETYSSASSMTEFMSGKVDFSLRFSSVVSVVAKLVVVRAAAPLSELPGIGRL